MEVSFYKEQIEKTAGIKDKAITFLGNNKKMLTGAGIAGAGLGTAYLASPKDGKKKVKEATKTIGKSILTAQVNGQAQDIVKDIAGVVGTGIALKNGKSLGKAVIDGGLKGMAIGDIAGAATIPTYQLYKKHKKEFGEAPDAKSLATLMAANVLPTTAMWGGIYGLKNGAKYIGSNPGKIGKAIKKGGTTVSKVTDNLADGVGDIIKGGKQVHQDYRSFVPKKPKELSQISKRVKQSNLSQDEIAKYKSIIESYNSRLGKASDLLKEVGDIDGARKIIAKDFKSMGSGAKKIVKSTVPLAAAAEIAALPTYFATPENIVKLKKKRQSENKN